ncbi:glycosyltransferase [Halioglobus maricola]|nr:glycosyltransferase [Halioglobus maricola]
MLASQFNRELAVEFIIVDNGSSCSLEKHIPQCNYRLITPGKNLGYAGGINLALTCSDAEYVCVLNPDVYPQPECLPLLLSEAIARKGIVGPRMYIDPGCRMLLPCNEERTRQAEFFRTIGTRSSWLLQHARHRWRHHQRTFMEARTPVESHDLSGAMLVFSREIYDSVGRFDERFQLYFEESDWLKRAKSAGAPAFYIPSAVALHLYNQSAVSQKFAQKWMENSTSLFAQLHYGTAFRRLMSFLAKENLEQEKSVHELLDIGELSLRDLSQHHFPVSVELAAYPDGFPGLIEIVGYGDRDYWVFSADAWETLATGHYIVQVVSWSGKELRRSKVARNV